MPLHTHINKLFRPVRNLLMSQIMYKLGVIRLVAHMIVLLSPFHNINKRVIFILFSVRLAAGTPANKEFRVLAVLGRACVCFDIFEQGFELVEELL